MPSDLYLKIHELAMHLGRMCGDESQKDATGPDLFELRTADAKHSWGHAAYVRSRNGLLHEMNNEQFLAYMSAHEGVVNGGSAKLHEIFVDEHKRTAVLQMSIFLDVAGEAEPLEQEMIWLMVTNDDATRMISTVEYVDATTAMRLAAAFDRKGKHAYGVRSSRAHTP